MAKLYVVGFLLNTDRTEVVLIRKNRPVWQAGLLNGVGGKVEPGEEFETAMRREFIEETGVAVGEWDLMCTVTWANDTARVDDEAATVAFFRAVWTGPEPLDQVVRSFTDERVEVHSLRHPRTDVIPNLRWLLPLAAYTVDRYEPFHLDATVVE